MKINRYSMEAETGAERDAIRTFLATVESERPALYGAITAMGHGGQRVIMVNIEPSIHAELKAMYRELESSGKDTIGNNLHWGDGELVMGYFKIHGE
jgi:hypothetical protein